MTIRLRFSSEPGITPWIVRAYTWSPWDHVEVQTYSGWLGARPHGGVQWRRPGYLKPSNFAMATIFWDRKQSLAFLEALYSQVNKPYDYGAIFGIATHHDWRNDGQWICSELVMWGSEKIGDPLLNLNQGSGGNETARYSPRDLAISRKVVFDK